MQNMKKSRKILKEKTCFYCKK